MADQSTPDPHATAPAKVFVAIKCRRPGCAGTQAEVLNRPGDQTRLYRCTTCNHVMVISTGGYFPV